MEELGIEVPIAIRNILEEQHTMLYPEIQDRVVIAMGSFL